MAPRLPPAPTGETEFIIRDTHWQVAQGLDLINRVYEQLLHLQHDQLLLRTELAHSAPSQDVAKGMQQVDSGGLLQQAESSGQNIEVGHQRWKTLPPEAKCVPMETKCVQTVEVSNPRALQFQDMSDVQTPQYPEKKVAFQLQEKLTQQFGEALGRLAELEVQWGRSQEEQFQQMRHLLREHSEEHWEELPKRLQMKEHTEAVKSLAAHQHDLVAHQHDLAAQQREAWESVSKQLHGSQQQHQESVSNSLAAQQIQSLRLLVLALLIS
jgi:hypothetical protein